MRKRYPICYPNIIIDGKERTEDVMEKDMKKQIAEASRELLFEDQVKKLTVKAIVNAISQDRRSTIILRISRIYLNGYWIRHPLS